LQSFAAIAEDDDLMRVSQRLYLTFQQTGGRFFRYFPKYKLIITIIYNNILQKS